MKYVDYFAFAIPFFIIAILFELVYQVAARKRLYRFKDLMSNISCGIGQQAIDIFLKVSVIAGYSCIYEHCRLFTIPVNFFTSIVLFILIDFSYYWFHRFAHRVNIMWGTHIVHHQSEEFNLSVALRQSWFDNVFNWFFYIPLAFLGFDDVMFFALFSMNTIYQFVIHTRTIKRLGFLELFMNTPSHHRVHHGRNSQYIDKNYGGVFIVWDRLFGTFENEGEDVIYGVTTPVHSSNPVWLNLSYWFGLGKNLKRIRKMKNKLLYLLYPPGTTANDDLKPAVLADPAAPHASAADNCRPLISLQNVYVAIGFCIIIIILGILLFFKENYDDAIIFQTISFLIISLSMMGEMIDEKKWVRYFEVPRIILLYYVATLLLSNTIPGCGYFILPVCILLMVLYYYAFWKRSVAFGNTMNTKDH